MDHQNRHSDYDVYRLCKAMREMNAVKFTNSNKSINEIIVGKSLLNMDEKICDSKDNLIISFVIESNNQKK